MQLTLERYLQDEGLREATALDGVAQRARDRLLPDDIVKALGPPLTRDYLVGHLSRGKAVVDCTAARTTCGT